MTTIYWAPFPGYKEKNVHEVNVLFKEPVPVFPYIASRRKGSEYIQCYGLMEYSKNTFAVLAPFDFEVKIDFEKKHVYTSLNQQMYDEFFINRGEERDASDPYLLTLPPAYLFYSDESVIMESMPAYLCPTESTMNINCIPGCYDIGKWVRPVDFSFEVIDASKEIAIKKDDPIFFIRFLTKDGSKVNLERVEYNERLLKASLACTGVKKCMRKTKLDDLYRMADSYLKVLGFKKKEKNNGK
jgi:hypothetical protein